MADTHGTPSNAANSAVVTPTTTRVNVTPPSRPDITLQGPADFQREANKQIEQFLATKTGQRWADAYRQTGKSVVIQPTTAGSAAEPTPTGTTIYFNPKRSTWYIAGDGSVQQLLPYQSMGHELIHALHNAEGSTAVYTPVGNNLKTLEEAYTIGIEPGAEFGITEAALLREIGQPARVDHVGFLTKGAAQRGRHQILSGRSDVVEVASTTSRMGLIIGISLAVAVAALVLIWMMHRKRDLASTATETTLGQFHSEVSVSETQVAATAPGSEKTSSSNGNTLTVVVPQPSDNGATYIPRGVSAAADFTASGTPDTLYQPFFNATPAGGAQVNTQGVAAVVNQDAVLEGMPGSSAAAAQTMQYAVTLNKQVTPLPSR